MVEERTKTFLKIRKRSLFVWVLRFIWFVWLVLWVDVAVGSWKEFEPKAAQIALVIFFISLFLGLLLWVKGYKKWKKERRMNYWTSD